MKGAVRGYDVRTGKRLWLFRTIPQPGEVGNETWENDSWAYTGNTGVWAQISVDEELGMAYLPVELPTHDYYGGARPGNNLFGESLVAVDLQTGQRKWHYQLVHHGIWDMDIPCAPILADITVNGRTIKAVAQPTKQAFLYVFDRVTGQPVWPIEERPVPKGDVPGERYSPTQPFPTRPPAYDRQGLAIDDLIDFTPELRAEAMKAIARYKIGPDLHAARREPGRRTDRARWRWATQAAGDELAGRLLRSRNAHPLRAVAERGRDAGARAAACRARRPTSVITRARCCRVRRRSGGSGSAHGRSAGGAVTSLDVQGLPLIKPPYGRISAIDLDTGDILLAGAARRNAGADPQSSGAEGADHSTHRTSGHRRHARHEDAAHRRRTRLRTDAIGAARVDAARLRQAKRQGCRRGLHASATERLADDLHVERQAVSGRRHQRG